MTGRAKLGLSRTDEQPRHVRTDTFVSRIIIMTPSSLQQGVLAVLVSELSSMPGPTFLLLVLEVLTSDL